jgi:hypothetical protein
MSRTYREHVDSREAFTAAEEAAYHEDTIVHEMADAEHNGPFIPIGPPEPVEDDEEYCDEFEDWLDEVDPSGGCDEEYDGQPDEYTEWQDFYGGDDWDHGQYDEY